MTGAGRAYFLFSKVLIKMDVAPLYDSVVVVVVAFASVEHIVVASLWRATAE